MEFLFLLPLIVILAVFWVMALISKEGRAIGLVEGHLSRCSEKPNCVCTEFSDDQAHYLPSIAIPENIKDPVELQNLIKGAVRELGGKIEIESHSYISAIFESRLLGFVDDFELRIDLNDRTINARSASRVGYSDFGVNSKRVKRFSALLQKRFKVVDQVDTRGPE